MSYGYVHRRPPGEEPVTLVWPFVPDSLVGDIANFGEELPTFAFSESNSRLTVAQDGNEFVNRLTYIADIPHSTGDGYYYAEVEIRAAGPLGGFIFFNTGDVNGSVMFSLQSSGDGFSVLPRAGQNPVMDAVVVQTPDYCVLQLLYNFTTREGWVGVNNIWPQWLSFGEPDTPNPGPNEYFNDVGPDRAGYDPGSPAFWTFSNIYGACDIKLRGTSTDQLLGPWEGATPWAE